MCTGGAACPRHTCAYMSTTHPHRERPTHKTQTQHVFVESTCAHRWRLTRRMDATHGRSNAPPKPIDDTSCRAMVAISQCWMLAQRCECACGCRPPLAPVLFGCQEEGKVQTVFSTFHGAKPNRTEQANKQTSYSPTARANSQSAQNLSCTLCRKGVDIL
jgi:hypothetical protein